MRKLINYKLLFLTPFILAACSNEDDTPSILPSNQPDAVELGITAGVTLTKSAVTAIEGLTGGIAVYAGIDGNVVSGEDPYTSALNNNYAIYAYASSWSRSGNDYIYLTSEKAKIFAHYPAYKPNNTDDPGALVISAGTALKASETSNKVSSTSTVDISIFPGKTTLSTTNYLNPSPNNADKVWGSSWAENTSNKSKIISAPGEVDYMWGSTNDDTSTQPVTSNGKAAGNSAHIGSVDLKMNHALAMVSFRIYNDGTYKNTGKLTKIQLRNTSSNTDLSNGGTNPNMKISDGAITEGSSPQAATYTRFIDDDGSGTPSGYTLVKIGSADGAGVVSSSTGTTNGNAEAAAASTKFSIMVLPVSSKASQNVEAVFTIDGADYPVALGSSSSDLTWDKGKNYLYTVKLSGKELSIGSVTVADWQAGTGKDDLVVQ